MVGPGSATVVTVPGAVARRVAACAEEMGLQARAPTLENARAANPSRAPTTPATAQALMRYHRESTRIVLNRRLPVVWAIPIMGETKPRVG